MFWGILNLHERYSLVGQTVHNDVTYCHDPSTDVMHTSVYLMTY